MSLAGGQLFYNNGSYIISPIEDYADYSCINCQLYQNEVPCHMTQAGCIDFQPSCTSVDSTISFMKEDLGIFWWDLNNNTGNRTPSCSSPDDERKMINGSAQCEFIIQHAGVQYGTFSDDCFIDLR